MLGFSTKCFLDLLSTKRSDLWTRVYIVFFPKTKGAEVVQRVGRAQGRIVKLVFSWYVPYSVPSIEEDSILRNHII